MKSEVFKSWELIICAAVLIEWSLAKWWPMPASSAADDSEGGAAARMGQAQKIDCEQPTSLWRVKEYHI